MYGRSLGSTTAQKRQSWGRALCIFVRDMTPWEDMGQYKFPASEVARHPIGAAQPPDMGRYCVDPLCEARHEGLLTSELQL